MRHGPGASWLGGTRGASCCHHRRHRLWCGQGGGGSGHAARTHVGTTKRLCCRRTCTCTCTCTCTHAQTVASDPTAATAAPIHTFTRCPGGAADATNGGAAKSVGSDAHPSPNGHTNACSLSACRCEGRGGVANHQGGLGGSGFPFRSFVALAILHEHRGLSFARGNDVFGQGPGAARARHTCVMDTGNQAGLGQTTTHTHNRDTRTIQNKHTGGGGRDSRKPLGTRTPDLFLPANASQAT